MVNFSEKEMLEKSLKDIEKKERQLAREKFNKFISTKNIFAGHKFYVLEHGTRVDLNSYGRTLKITIACKDKNNKLKSIIETNLDSKNKFFNETLNQLNIKMDYIDNSLYLKIELVEHEDIEGLEGIQDCFHHNHLIPTLITEVDFFCKAKELIDNLGIKIIGSNEKKVYQAIEEKAKFLNKQLEKIRKERKNKTLLYKIIDLFCIV